MRKVCVAVHSRANYARIKSVLSAIRNHANLDLQLVLGASSLLTKYGSLEQQLSRDGFTADSNVHFVIDGDKPLTMAKSTGLGIIEMASTLDNLKPDVVLTIADRYETMATAIAASYMNIPLAHTQGGEVTGSIDESVRHAITKLSHIHFPATKRSSDFLAMMGEDPSSIFLTGCPSLDLLIDLDLSIPSSFPSHQSGVGATVNYHQPYLVFLQHPVTTEYGSAAFQIEESLKSALFFADQGIQIIWLWPNVDAGSDDISKRLRLFRENSNSKNFHFFKNLTPEDYARLIYNSACLVGNSSSGIRESALLGVPAVNIGSRQLLRERASNVIDVDYDSTLITSAIEKQIKISRYPSSSLYGDGKAGKRIANHLATCPLSIKKKLNSNYLHLHDSHDSF